MRFCVSPTFVRRTISTIVQKLLVASRLLKPLPMAWKCRILCWKRLLFIRVKAAAPITSPFLPKKPMQFLPHLMKLSRLTLMRTRMNTRLQNIARSPMWSLSLRTLPMQLQSRRTKSTSIMKRIRAASAPLKRAPSNSWTLQTKLQLKPRSRKLQLVRALLISAKHKARAKPIWFSEPLKSLLFLMRLSLRQHLHSTKAV